MIPGRLTAFAVTLGLQAISGCGAGDGSIPAVALRPLSAAGLESAVVAFETATGSESQPASPTSAVSETSLTTADVVKAFKLANLRSPNADPDGPGLETAPPIGSAQLTRLDLTGDRAITVDDVRLIWSAVLAAKSDQAALGISRFIPVDGQDPTAIAGAVADVESRGPSASTLNQIVSARIFSDGRRSLAFNLFSYPDGCNFNLVPSCTSLNTPAHTWRSRFIVLHPDENGRFKDVTEALFGTADFSIGVVAALKAVDLNGDGIDDFIAGGNKDHEGAQFPYSFDRSMVLLSEGPGRYRRHILGPSGFYEASATIFLDRDSAVVVFAANNYQGYTDGSQGPTPAFGLFNGAWIDVTDTLIQPSEAAGCCGKYLASSQFIALPGSAHNRETRYLIDNTQRAAVDYRLWSRTESGVSFRHSQTERFSDGGTIEVTEYWGERVDYPLVEIDGVKHVLGGWLDSCVIFRGKDLEPVGVSGVSLLALPSPTPAAITKRTPPPGGSPWGENVTLVNVLVALRVSNEKLVSELIRLPEKFGTNFGKFSCEDVNGDGRTDLVLQPDEGGSLKIFVQKEDGSFVPAGSRIMPRDLLRQTLITDIDGDGKPDLVSVPIGLKLDPSLDMAWRLKAWLGRR